MSIKQQVKTGLDTSKRVGQNAEQFIQATALVVLIVKVVGDLRTETLDRVWVWVLSAAVAVAMVRAFVEYVKFLDKK